MQNHFLDWSGGGGALVKTIVSGIRNLLIFFVKFTPVAVGHEHNLTGRWFDTPAVSQEYHGFFQSLVRKLKHEAHLSLPFSAEVTSFTEFSFG